MDTKLKLVIIDSKYCDYLRKYDKRVPYNFSKKENRPFVGVLFKIDDMEYFAPLSSPKEKHIKMSNMVDFLKINDGKLGAVNFNNMIPVTNDYYKVVILNKKYKDKEKEVYRTLLNDQLTWLNENYKTVTKKTKRLYKLYIDNKLSSKIRNRCCNFPLLEEKCNEYNKKQTIISV